MRDVDRIFLGILSSALHGCPASAGMDMERGTWRRVIQLSAEHRILPMIVQASWEAGADREELTRPSLRRAKELTFKQAQRTADFLVLYSYLNDLGLRPVVLKGIAIRDLYPHPEQRPSIDEDLLIGPGESDAMHAALAGFGLVPEGDGDPGTSQETTYRDRRRGLYIEVHRELFPTDSHAYSECNSLFEGAAERAVDAPVYGVPVRTLAPADHLLFLICHAYKHLLHGGVGIRQVCDICIMAEKWDERIDWGKIRSRCEKVRISKFAAGLFLIGERYLGCQMPDIFKDVTVDPDPLLEDILSGGVYGVKDIDRAHSAIITLDAVAADREGRRKRSVTSSVFLPLRSMSNKYPYLRKYPYLLPIAWAQRVFNYISGRKEQTKVNPAKSIRIGRERIRLLRQYGIIR